MSTSQAENQIQSELTNLNEALEAAGIFLALEIRDGSLILSGEVDSLEMRDAALDLSQMVGDRLGVRIEDAIEIMDIEFDLTGDNPNAEFDVNDALSEAGAVSDVGTTWNNTAAEDGVPFFPPTDPVVGSRLVGEDSPEV